MHQVHYKPLDVQKVASTFTVEGLSTNSTGKLLFNLCHIIIVYQAV